MQRQLSTPIKPDLSGSCLQAIIVHYIKLRDKKYGIKTDTELMKFFTETEGHCVGFSVLRAFTLLITVMRPNRNKKNSDDNAWFTRTIESMTKWNGQDPDEIAPIIEPFIAKIVYFQRNIQVFPLLALNGSNLHESVAGIATPHYCLEFTQEVLVDGIMKTQTSHLKKEDTCIFPTQSHLPPLLEAAIPENRMVLIGTENHLMCVLKTDELLIYVDPRFPEGDVICFNFSELAQAVERSIREISDPPVICIDIYSLADQAPLSELPSAKVIKVMQDYQLDGTISFHDFYNMLKARSNSKQIDYAYELYRSSLKTNYNAYLTSVKNNVNSFFSLLNPSKPDSLDECEMGIRVPTQTFP